MINNLDHDKINEVDNNRNNNDKYRNMTKIQFNHKDNIVICNIFKYNIHSYDETKLLKNIIVDTEMNLDYINDDNGKKIIRNYKIHNINKLLNRKHKKLNKNQDFINIKNIIKSKQKLLEFNAIIIKLGKTNTSVTHIDKINNYIEKNEFREMKSYK